MRLGKYHDIAFMHGLGSSPYDLAIELHFGHNSTHSTPRPVAMHCTTTMGSAVKLGLN